MLRSRNNADAMLGDHYTHTVIAIWLVMINALSLWHHHYLYHYSDTVQLVPVLKPPHDSKNLTCKTCCEGTIKTVQV